MKMKLKIHFNRSPMKGTQLKKDAKLLKLLKLIVLSELKLKLYRRHKITLMIMKVVQMKKR